jgi:hypothetical protein
MPGGVEDFRILYPYPTAEKYPPLDPKITPEGEAGNYQTRRLEMFRYTIPQLLDTYRFFKQNLDGIVNIHGRSFPKSFDAQNWRQWFQGCLHEKINRNIITTGRKHDPDYQTELRRAANLLNHRPRLIIDYLPPDLKQRFKHRLRGSD